MPKYVEQNGNIFKESSPNNYEYVPRKIEQGGNIFEFDAKAKDYKFVQASNPIQTSENMTPVVNDGLKVGFQKGMTLGARPAVAGLGAGAGAFVGSLQQGMGIGESFKAGKEAYSEGRQEAIAEEDALAKQYPKSMLAGEIGGSILTSPLTPIKGLGSAIKAGAIGGLGQAIGRSDSLTNAGETIATNAALGAGTYGATKAIGGAIQKGKQYFKAMLPEKVLAKVASASSGVSDQDILTYAKNTDEINKLINQYKGNVPEAADVARQKLTNQIQNTKKILSEQIGDALERASSNEFRVSGDIVEKGASISVDPIIGKINKIKGQFHAEFEDEAIESIDSAISKIQRASQDGKINVVDLFKLKDYLMNKSQKAFIKNGQIFMADPKASRALKAGYFEAKNILDEIAPEIKQANQKLHQLHVLEENMNANLIGPGKPEAAFLAAGAGQNKRNENILNQLGKITGTEPIGEARKISAMRSFNEAKILPEGEKTGYAGLRVLSGAGIGAGVAELAGEDWKTGGVIGAAASGPLALKTYINAANISGKALEKLVGTVNDPKIRTTIMRVIAQESTNNKNDNDSSASRRIRGRF